MENNSEKTLRQLFEEGRPFMFSGDIYKYKKDEPGGYLIKMQVGVAGYFGNVPKITEKGFSAFTFFLGKKVAVKVEFSKCNFFGPKLSEGASNE